MDILKIYGPPGTGKTHQLMALLEKELQNTPPDRIAFCTFTRSARLEILERTKLHEEDLPYVKTLHAICYKLLGTRQDELVKPKDIRAFGKAIGVQLSGNIRDMWQVDEVSEGYYQPTKADRLLQLNHLGRHRGLKLRETLRDAPVELDYNYAKWFTEAYRNWKDANNLIDYTDLLQLYYEGRGKQLDVDVVFIDESQDLSWLQWQVAHRLMRNAERVYMAGDDDQTIFGFAGASAELFYTEPCTASEVLPQSYRIPRVVHDISQRIIKRVKVRQEKEFKPREAEGMYRPVGHLEHALFDDRSHLILFRNHHRGLQLATQLEELGIPFTGGHSVLADQEVRLALQGWDESKTGFISPAAAKALAHMATNQYLQPGARDRVTGRGGDKYATSSILNVDGIGASWNQVLARLPKFNYLQRIISRYGFSGIVDPKVKLMSIHQSKGREAETVILDLELARRTYEAYMIDPDTEHRIYYVGCTRAKDRLFTLLPTDPKSYVI